MKVLASSAFAMQPPTRNVSAATPARATATPPTPASSARSGLVHIKSLNGPYVKIILSKIQGPLNRILSEQRFPSELRARIDSLISACTSAEKLNLFFDPRAEAVYINNKLIAHSSVDKKTIPGILQELEKLLSTTATPV